MALSRGEHVEIGGSFRMPDIMAQSGAELVEVGTTNRTRQADYRAAMEAGKVQYLLKVHTSNYKLVGYTQETSLSELVGLGRAYGLSVLYDLGGGSSCPPGSWGSPRAPPRWPRPSGRGPTWCAFPGTSCWAGPRPAFWWGGSGPWTSSRPHPMVRALRPGKETLAALEATLQLYQDPARARRDIPTLAMLSAPLEELEGRPKPWPKPWSRSAGPGAPWRWNPARARPGAEPCPASACPPPW